jgi:hypothetical protein
MSSFSVAALVCIVQGVSVYLFATGFFLTRLELHHVKSESYLQKARPEPFVLFGRDL